MKQILLLILSFVFVLPGNAQQTNADPLHLKITPQINPRVKAILDNQVYRASNKTTSLEHRLIGYAYSSSSGNQTYYDTMHAFYSAGRGSSFANCLENIDANFGSKNMKPDSIWVKDGSGNYFSIHKKYTYDNQNRVTVYEDKFNKMKLEYTLDGAGNAIIQRYYDTSGSGNGSLILQGTTYCTYDNQNRLLFDSVWHQWKSKRIYSAYGLDTIIVDQWVNTLWVHNRMEINTYNAAGLPATYQYFSWDQSTNSWYPVSRAFYTYDNNGRLSVNLQQGYFNNTWGNAFKDTVGYTGNNPLYTYVAIYNSYDAGTNTWIGGPGSGQNNYHLNAAGNWDTVYLHRWDTMSANWKSSIKQNIEYNANDLVSGISTFNYNNTTGTYDANPFIVEAYYYEDYYPTSVPIENVKSTAISLYPNPGHTAMTLKYLSATSGNANVKVVDMVGKQVWKQTLPFTAGSNETVFDVHSWASGIYFLSFEVDHNISTIKMIVE